MSNLVEVDTEVVEVAISSACKANYALAGRNAQVVVLSVGATPAHCLALVSPQSDAINQVACVATNFNNVVVVVQDQITVGIAGVVAVRSEVLDFSAGAVDLVNYSQTNNVLAISGVDLGNPERGDVTMSEDLRQVVPCAGVSVSHADVGRLDWGSPVVQRLEDHRQVVQMPSNSSGEADYSRPLGYVQVEVLASIAAHIQGLAPVCANSQTVQEVACASRHVVDVLAACKLDRDFGLLA